MCIRDRSVRRAQIPNKVSNKMLNDLLVPVAGKSDGEVGQQQSANCSNDRGRPAHGIILIPVESAANAAVHFNPSGKQRQEREQRAQELSDTAAAATSTSTARRVGFKSTLGCVLHYETIHELSQALSSDPRGLHTWVAAESDRLYPLPDAFHEVWAQCSAKHEEDMGPAAALASTGRSTNIGGDAEDDERSLDAEVLQARLRRRMRDAMHDTMQRANPESYYQSV